MQITPGRIARWLRAYRDWVAEVNSPGRVPAIGGAGPGSGSPGKPTAREAERLVELRTRIARVDHWLSLLTPVERVAAEYWLEDDAGSISAIADDLGLHYNRARHLVLSIPVIIWGHLYRPVDENAKSS